MLRHRHHFSPLRFSVREEKFVQVDLEFFASRGDQFGEILTVH
jgi:hypothetical protein